MTITIELNRNKWLLVLQGEYEGHCVNKRYRNKENIRQFVDSLDSPNKVFLGINDMKLSYDDCTIVLKDYRKNKNRGLYKRLVKKIDPSVPIMNILFSNVDKISSVAKVAKKIVNMKSVVAITLSLVLANSIFSGDSTNLQEQLASITPIEFEQPVEFNVDEVDSVIADEQVSFDIDEYMSLDNRIEEFENVEFLDAKGNFNIGSKLDEYALNKLVSFIDENGQSFYEYSSNYGIDPYLLLSVSMTECSLNHKDTIPGGKNFNGCGYGIMQIENVNIGNTVTAFNYETNQYDSILITEEKLIDFESNVQIGAMLMQNCLERYNNNVYLAIQSYNYGEPVMDMLIDKYASEIGKTYEEVTLDINDLGWMKYVDDMHNNPQKYLPNWQYSTYGNNEYINSVLGYYMGQNMIINSKDNYYVYDLISNTCVLKNNEQFVFNDYDNMEKSRII